MPPGAIYRNQCLQRGKHSVIVADGAPPGRQGGRAEVKGREARIDDIAGGTPVIIQYPPI